MRSKSQYIEIDALVAIGILIIGLIYLKTLATTDTIAKPMTHYSIEAVKLLRTLKIEDVSPALLSEMQASQFSAYVDTSYNLARQIGIMYIKTELDSDSIIPTNEERNFDSDLIQFALESQIPNEFGYGVYLVQNLADPNDAEKIYSRNGEDPALEDDIAVSRLVIIGINPYQQAQGGDPFQFWPSVLEVRVWG